MEISEILTPDRVTCDIAVSSKKAALEALAGMIADTDEELTQPEVFESLIAREKLGSTGLGNGIAIPHGRQKGSTKTIGAFMRLQLGVTYDAIDHQPVDLLFALLVPEESTDAHLQILSKLAAKFSDAKALNKFRECKNNEQLFDLLVSST
jgi:PTS system nitrogen regulatory IIA component